MYHIRCNGCLNSVLVDDVSDPDAAMVCPPGTDCCSEDHHHGEAANSCTQEHDGDCHVDNPDCPVCRPLTITYVSGAVAATN